MDTHPTFFISGSCLLPKARKNREPFGPLSRTLGRLLAPAASTPTWPPSSLSDSRSPLTVGSITGGLQRDHVDARVVQTVQDAVQLGPINDLNMQVAGGLYDDFLRLCVG